MGETLLEMVNINKEFPGVRALSNINFDLKKGEVHCICGENGAGKSTLIKIISGAYQPDEGGEICFEGKRVQLNPKYAMELGIQTIYQEHSVFGTLNVTENLFTGMEITKNGVMQHAQMRKRTKEVLEYLNSNIDPDAIVGNLTSGEQKMVEIAKALITEAKIIILDEPTASFSLSEIDYLLNVIEEIKKSGIGIIYISHHLEEVFKIADRITVIRDGNWISNYENKDIDESRLIKDMVGRDASAFYNRESVAPGEVVFEAKDISGKGVSAASFKVRRGEIVGFAGMVGSGRSELMDILFGVSEKFTGETYIKGKKVELKTPTDAIENGMCYITEDRQHTGLFLKQTIAENTISADLVKMKKAIIKPKEVFEIGDEYIKKVGTKANDSHVLAMNLSGGNQQKVVLAKWFVTDGDIYIFDEPTRGIDIGAKQEIYQIMVNLLKAGKAIIMVSSDMPEVISMSDRVLVMCKGRVVGELTKDELTEENILKYSIGGAGI